MSRSLAELAREASALPPQERLTLARILLQASDSAVPEPLSDLDAAWEDEIGRRMGTIDSGRAEGKAWDEVLSDLNKRFGW